MQVHTLFPEEGKIQKKTPVCSFRATFVGDLPDWKFLVPLFWGWEQVVTLQCHVAWSQLRNISLVLTKLQNCISHNMFEPVRFLSEFDSKILDSLADHEVVKVHSLFKSPVD